MPPCVSPLWRRQQASAAGSHASAAHSSSSRRLFRRSVWVGGALLLIMLGIATANLLLIRLLARGEPNPNPTADPITTLMASAQASPGDSRVPGVLQQQDTPRELPLGVGLGLGLARLAAQAGGWRHAPARERQWPPTGTSSWRAWLEGRGVGKHAHDAGMQAEERMQAQQPVRAKEGMPAGPRMRAEERRRAEERMRAAEHTHANDGTEPSVRGARLPEVTEATATALSADAAEFSQQAEHAERLQTGDMIVMC